MDITIDLFGLIELMACTTAFMLAFLFSFKQPKANLFLGLFLFSLAFEILNPLTHTIALLNEANLIFNLNFTLLTLVFLLFYVKKIIGNKILLIDYLLFLPGIVFNLFFLDSTEDIYYRIIEYSINLFIIFYIYFILKKHEESLVEFYSEIEQKTLSWIKNILLTFIFFHLIWITEDLMHDSSEIISFLMAMSSSIVTFCLVYWIGYKGIAQPEIFNETLFKNNIIEEETTTPTIIDEEKRVNYNDKVLFENLKDTIIDEKLYTNPNTNLRSLAIDLGIKEKELSRLINSCGNVNFYHFINQFRVDEFKKLLLTPKANQLSTLGLAQEAGFSSKSTFYSAFKKIEGMTPKQYEMSIKKSE